MNITYFLSDITNCGGIQQTTCLVINSLLQKKEDYRISTVSLHHKFQSVFFDLSDKVNNVALFDYEVNPRRDRKKIEKKLKKALNLLNSDLLIVQAVAYAIFVPISFYNSHKVIVCEHGYYGMGKVLGLHWFGIRRALKRASAIVTLTDLDANNYRKRNYLGKIIRRIYNPIVPIQNNEPYDLCSKTIVCCGSLDAIKRFDHVIKAAKIVHEKYPEWKWIIYGDGRERENLQNMINDYSLQDVISLPGYEKDKDVIYRGKALFVLTSRFEGFGMVLIEAMEYGIPLISYDVKYGPKEIVIDGVNGGLVDDGNIQGLAEMVEEYISDNNRRSQISNGCSIYLNQFLIENISERWICLFNEV